MRSNFQMIQQHAQASGAKPQEKHYHGSRDWAHNATTDRRFTTYGRVVQDMAGAEPDFTPTPDPAWMYRKSAAPMQRDRRSRRIK